MFNHNISRSFSKFPVAGGSVKIGAMYKNIGFLIGPAFHGVLNVNIFKIFKIDRYEFSIGFGRFFGKKGSNYFQLYACNIWEKSKNSFLKHFQVGVVFSFDGQFGIICRYEKNTKSNQKEIELQSSKSDDSKNDSKNSNKKSEEYFIFVVECLVSHDLMNLNYDSSKKGIFGNNIVSYQVPFGISYGKGNTEESLKKVLKIDLSKYPKILNHSVYSAMIKTIIENKIAPENGKNCFVILGASGNGKDNFLNIFDDLISAQGVSCWKGFLENFEEGKGYPFVSYLEAGRVNQNTTLFGMQYDTLDMQGLLGRQPGRFLSECQTGPRETAYIFSGTFELDYYRFFHIFTDSTKEYKTQVEEYSNEVLKYFYKVYPQFYNNNEVRDRIEILVVPPISLEEFKEHFVNETTNNWSDYQWSKEYCQEFLDKYKASLRSYKCVKKP